jgi:DNA-binding response OmpR family regulator
MKILLIDDDVFLRDMYATKFISSGYEVETSDGGASTLSLLGRGNKYDVAIFDMIMPGTSGVELLK